MCQKVLANTSILPLDYRATSLRAGPSSQREGEVKESSSRLVFIDVTRRISTVEIPRDRWWRSGSIEPMPNKSKDREKVPCPSRALRSSGKNPEFDKEELEKLEKQRRTTGNQQSKTKVGETTSSEGTTTPSEKKPTPSEGTPTPSEGKTTPIEGASGTNEGSTPATNEEGPGRQEERSQRSEDMASADEDEFQEFSNSEEEDEVRLMPLEMGENKPKGDYLKPPVFSGREEEDVHE